MIEPLPLPEAFRLKSREDCRRPMPGPSFEIGNRRLEPAIPDFAEQMEMRRHHNVLNHLPFLPLPAMFHGFDDHLRDGLVTKMRRPFRLIQQVFHLAKYHPLQLEPIGRMVISYCSQRFTQFT